MNIRSDIQTYKAAKQAHRELYASIDDRRSAIENRHARWDANRRLREAAENLVMSVIGEHQPALMRAGLLQFYEEMAAGKASDVVLLKIADETVLAFDK